MKFNKKENEWLMKCHDERDKYQIIFDNKRAVVCEKASKKPVFVFGTIGVELVTKLLDVCEVDVEF